MKAIKHLLNPVTALAAVALAAGMASCGNNDDDDWDFPSRHEYAKALWEMYPDADDVDWKRTPHYMVAEFDDRDDYDVEVWFDSGCRWVMTVTDFDNHVSQLPAAVRRALAESDFHNWKVDNIDYVERRDGYFYIVDCERSGYRDTDLVFDEAGHLLQTWPGGIGDVTPSTSLIL